MAYPDRYSKTIMVADPEWQAWCGLGWRTHCGGPIVADLKCRQTKARAPRVMHRVADPGASVD